MDGGFWNKIVNEAAWINVDGKSQWKIFAVLFGARVLLAAALIVGVVFTVALCLPEKPKADKARLDAAQACAKTIRSELNARCRAYRIVACEPFTGDLTDSVYYAARSTLTASGPFDVASRGFMERLRGIAGLSQRGVSETEKAARSARRVGADAVLLGAVKRFEKTERGAALVVEYRLVDAQTCKEVYSAVYDSEEEAREDERETKGDQDGDGAAPGVEKKRSAFDGVLLWLLAVLAFPIAAFRFLESAASKRSNGANAFALLTCLAFDAAVGYYLIRPELDGRVSVLLAVFALLGAFWYDSLILWVAHRRKNGAPSA